ncbi:MAG: hypothetical protein IH586_17155 [Anaerolineaceae bacterium]|nr:hypothetical protein [Anaerolineaceae bacterium]
MVKMNINSKMKEEIQVNIKKYLPLVISLFLVAIAAFLILSSCKPKAVETVIGEDGEVISQPKGDYSVWQYKTVTAKCGVDRQTGDIVCTRVKDGDASKINNFVSDAGKEGWELVDTLATGDVNTFIFKRPK